MLYTKDLLGDYYMKFGCSSIIFYIHNMFHELRACDIKFFLLIYFQERCLYLCTS